jgi:hypothetical protein
MRVLALTDAFYELAQTSSSDSYNELMIFFAYIELPFDEFIGWLKGQGFKAPEFWRPSDGHVATDDCEYWPLPNEEPKQLGAKLAYRCLKRKYPDGLVPKLPAETLAKIATPYTLVITGTRKKLTRDSVRRALGRRK